MRIGPPDDDAMDHVRLILASASPRRRELLGQLGEPFRVVVSPIEELQAKPPTVSPRAWASALAYFKSRAVADQPTASASSDAEIWVLGADTIVECDGVVLGKARDPDDARRMLRLQAGRGCEVVTGVCLLRIAGSRISRHIAIACTHVHMRDDADEIERYVASGEWAGKAGAYGIQDVGDRLVERIDGSFSNVVGLPMELVTRMWHERERIARA